MQKRKVIALLQEKTIGVLLKNQMKLAEQVDVLTKALHERDILTKVPQITDARENMQRRQQQFEHLLNPNNQDQTAREAQLNQREEGNSEDGT